jgi:hypothetical protein
MRQAFLTETSGVAGIVVVRPVVEDRPGCSFGNRLTVSRAALGDGGSQVSLMPPLDSSRYFVEFSRFFSIHDQQAGFFSAQGNDSVTVAHNVLLYSY